ncbi:dicarboxylate transporter/tellurite-resistance protein TehA [Methylobacterium sp. WSM2598]|uniref:dicarboxylate transporter/tellurite-resistance protein TehA n=1 Tax=Methylobacterium sp. WSM2598 TaxID=398261 RepID=UPI00037363A2|nr:dicarboxylate transporter/tellurite-resistance protein TehA [Methylobacterium sp. WSM2598]
MARSFPAVPASFFGMVLGLVGLGAAWRAAAQLWGAPSLVGEAVMLLGVAVWAAVAALYGAKWLRARPAALDEALHPVQCCFIGLAGVSTMLVALAALPYARPLAFVLFGLGGLFTLGFAVWRTGGLWQGGRDVAATTPVLYLPTVAGGFVTAAAASAFGLHDLAQLAFGAALLSWLAIESVLLHRLYTGPTLGAALRPTLGIQLAPPAVGGVAFLSLGGDPAGPVALGLFGYGLLQGLVMLRLVPFLRGQGFSPAFWSFSFGATALASLGLRIGATGQAPAVAALAPPVFLGANLLVGWLVLGTLRLLAAGRLVAAPAPPPPAEPLLPQAR